mmetsp:Transcript_9608/g.13303  ORF Transcript_9608/g.13303 Transcript_9608/m.13303 type:complete len:115 (-) Transcript_9608:2052-2396(-)
MDSDDDEREDGEQHEYISDEAIMFNRSTIDSFRSYITIFAGVATGILGATGLRGLWLFLASYGFSSLCLALKMRLDTEAFANEKIYMFLFGNMGSYGLSFVLFWTLSYALVYIY